MSDTTDYDGTDLPADMSSSRARERLYEVMDDDGRSYAEKREWALTVGCEYLDTENGHVERVTDGGDTHVVEASVGGPPGLLPQGERLDAATTYCRRTLESDDVLALSDAESEGWADDPAYERHGFDCYLGAPITVDGEKYGTVCFVSRAATPDEFTDEERVFVELVGRLLGRQRERETFRTALEDAETQRRRSERLRSGLFETAPDAVVVAESESGEIVKVNEAATELSGYTEDELLGRSVFDLVPSHDRDGYVAVREAATTSGRPHTELPDGRELLLEHASGRTIPIEVSVGTTTVGDTQYDQFVVRDITDRRERERQIRLKDRAFDEVDVGVTIADANAADYPLQYVNEAFTEITGYDATDAVGVNCRFLQGPATDEGTLDEIRAGLAAESTVEVELLNYRADGSKFWNELTITPVEGPTGEVTHFAGIQRDVTERKRRERLIRVLNRVLRHNLRNDLNVIRGYADEVRKATDGDTTELDRIVETAEDLSQLGDTARLLETVAGEETTCRPVAVVPIVEDVAETLREEYPEATVTVESAVPEEQTVLATDRLASALAELVENAIRHTDASRAEVTVVPTADGVGVRVADEGDGIPQQDRRVLTGGEETKLNHASSLGVWLVAWLIDGFDGSISVAESATGTTVEVELRAGESET